MILVTGGAGYIGSHTVVELLNNNKEVVVCDDLSNSSEKVLDRVYTITGKKVIFYKYNICNYEQMKEIFQNNKIDSIIHFAGFKAVGESVSKPYEYYQNNIDSTLILLRLMKEFGVNNLVFSSSATVYGNPKALPIKEDFELSATNPYGRTKLFIEYILKDMAYANKNLNIALLRYFNPIGAHASGLIGESPNGTPNNLMPYITQVAIGKLEYLNVFGNDYNTHDGTGVRDYIHVCDLARGHLLALNKLDTNPGLVIYNLGTGVGYSVLDLVKTFGKVIGKDIPYKIVSRRPGDIDACYADPTLAYKELGFKTQFDLEDMCKDSWKWQSNNPKGYEEK